MSLFDEIVRGELRGEKVLCKDHYDECLKFWNENISMAIYPIQEKALNEIWADERFSEPTEENIRFKCVILDRYYSTNLKEGLYRKGNNSPMVTDNIIADKCFIEKVKSVKKDDDEKIVRLVEQISTVYSTQARTHQKRITSFASKFCSRYNPEAFPIYDNLVKRMLYLINSDSDSKYHFSTTRITLNGLETGLENNYGNYKRAVDLFMEKFKDKIPEMETYKDFDMYMWSWAKMIMNVVMERINEDIDDSELQ